MAHEDLSTGYHDLSPDLLPIVHFELSNGNEIARIDRPAGTACPLAVVFTRRLKLEQFRASNTLPDTIEIWENTDSHYDLERGYVSITSRHVVSGPK